MNDTTANVSIMAGSDPNEMTRIGRAVANFDEAKWSSMRKEVLFDIKMARFDQNDALKAKLLDTAGRKGKK